MFDAFRAFTDRLLGRGSAAIAVPVMDGVLKPNRVLDNAEVVAELPDLDDLAVAQGVLWMTAGPALYRLDADGPVEVRRFERPITALAAATDGSLALALGGTELLLLGPDGQECARLQSAGGRALRCINAIAFDAAASRWLFTEGSAEHDNEGWCRDLMTHGASGRVSAWTPRGGVQDIAHGLRHAYGVLAQGGAVLASESWSHRVMQWPEVRVRVAQLPGYPSRMVPAAGGGFWLCCFVCRTQLVEFVLREDSYRRRMIHEVDPRYWIAPALSSGHSFLEPLQGAGVKQMGVLKPWAPPRSYGLVVRVDAQGQVCASLHSQVDGRHHGITAVAEHAQALYVVSKGSNRLLRVTTVPTEQGANR